MFKKFVQMYMDTKDFMIFYDKDIYKDEAHEAFMLNSPGASSSSFSGSFAVNEFSRHFRI